MKKIYFLSIVFFFSVSLITSQTVIFQKTFDFSSKDEAYDILPLSDGDFFIVGGTVGNTGVYNILLMKINNSGDTLWTKTFGGDYFSFGRRIIQSSDNNYLIGGLLNDTAYILKVSALGDSLWSKSFPTEYSSYVSDLIQMPNGEIIFTKIINLYPAASQIQKIDSTGNILWSNESFATVYSDLELYSDSEFYLSGYKGDLDYHVFLKKFDISGNTIFYKQFIEYYGTNTSLEISENNIFLGGSRATGSNYVSSIIKTDLEGMSENWYDLETPTWLVRDLTIDNNGNILACSDDSWYLKLFVVGMTQNGEILGADTTEMPYCFSMAMTDVNEYLYLTGGINETKSSDILLMKFNIDSLTVNIDELDKIVNNYRISPNPAKDKVTVYIPESIDFEKVHIQMWNNSGQKINVPILSKDRSYEIPLIRIKSGIYYISISSPTQKYTGKIIISH